MARDASTGLNEVHDSNGPLAWIEAWHNDALKTRGAQATRSGHQSGGIATVTRARLRLGVITAILYFSITVSRGGSGKITAFLGQEIPMTCANSFWGI